MEKPILKHIQLQMKLQNVGRYVMVAVEALRNGLLPLVVRRTGKERLRVM